MQRRVPDISKIEKAIGFSPTMNLEKIIQDIMRSNREDKNK